MAYPAFALYDVHKVVDDTVFQTHDYVEIAQADVRVYDHHAVFPHGQGGADSWQWW